MKVCSFYVESFSAFALIITMGWSSEQQKRLGLEKAILETYFKHKVQWINPTSRGETRVEVQMTTTNNKNFTLRLYLPNDFPNSCPEMVVCNPSSPLVKKDGSFFNSVSGTDHTYGTKDGMTKICHFYPAKWTSENTLYQVFMKGLIWLEAYEGHRATGQPISNFLREFSSSETDLREFSSSETDRSQCCMA